MEPDLLIWQQKADGCLVCVPIWMPMHATLHLSLLHPSAMTPFTVLSLNVILCVIHFDTNRLCLSFNAPVQERFYFGDTVLPLFESGIPLVKQKLCSLPDADNITIAYPDEGSWKRFHYQFGEYPEVQSPNDFLPWLPRCGDAHVDVLHQCSLTQLCQNHQALGQHWAERVLMCDDR